MGTEVLNTSDRGPSLQATGAVIGNDGAVLATVSCHTEHPATTLGDSSEEAPLVVVDVVGEIDLDSAPLLRSVLTDVIRRERQVCCDLSGVAFLGAEAVNTLFAACADADEAGCVLTVRGVHGIGARVSRSLGWTTSGLPAMSQRRTPTSRARHEGKNRA